MIKTSRIKEYTKKILINVLLLFIGMTFTLFPMIVDSFLNDKLSILTTIVYILLVCNFLYKYILIYSKSFFLGFISFYWYIILSAFIKSNFSMSNVTMIYFLLIVMSITTVMYIKSKRLKEENKLIIFLKSLRTLFILTYSLILCVLLFDRFVPASINRYSYNLIPFKTIYHFLSYEGLAIRIVIENILGNIILFIPIGLVIASFKMRLKNKYLFAILIPIMIEVTQLVTYRGSMDIDDVILNTLGHCIGIWIILFISKKNEKICT